MAITTTRSTSRIAPTDHSFTASRNGYGYQRGTGQVQLRGEDNREHQPGDEDAEQRVREHHPLGAPGTTPQWAVAGIADIFVPAVKALITGRGHTVPVEPVPQTHPAAAISAVLPGNTRNSQPS
jgi:hypothetical protein